MRQRTKKGSVLAHIGRCTAALALAVLFLASSAEPGLAATWADVNDLKSEASSLDAEKKELQAKLDALADDKSEAINRKTLLDQQIANTTAQIQNVEAQISQYASLITQTQAELVEAQEKEEAQYELFCQRVRAMEERGTISYWSVLFKADSFTDLLSRLDIINEIMDSDQAVIAELEALQAEIETKMSELETSKAEEEQAKAELVSKKNELDAQRKEANAVIQELSSNENETEAALSELQAQQDALWAEAQRLSDQLVAQQAANGQSTESNPGGYIWPVDSRYITSTMGGRTSPGGIGSTNHKGIDIAAPKGTPVYAADGGTVTYAGWMSGYGYLVQINHGNGYVTYYGHNSSLLVSVGQHVYKGQQIARVGSTGNSTGNHCHFEIRYNGVAKNPLNYL